MKFRIYFGPYDYLLLNSVYNLIPFPFFRNFVLGEPPSIYAQPDIVGSSLAEGPFFFISIFHFNRQPLPLRPD
jgi:hypothetical protein